MKSRYLRHVLLSVGFLLMTSATAWAQRPAHYYPLHAPLSPYLYYSAINTTGLPNYYTYIRPAQRFQSYLERRPTDLARLETRVRLDESRVAEMIQRHLEVRETTGLGAPATPATFMDYSHYFSRPPVAPKKYP
jgi:hypothetical protein